MSVNTPAALITSSRELRKAVAAHPLTQSRLTKLQNWQVARLRQTYDDFSSQPRYHDALEFFVNDLYGTRDYSQLEAQLSKVLRMLQRLLPAPAMHALKLVLQLEGLSLSLDLDMTQYLDGRDITHDVYQQAYRRVGRITERRQQIMLVVESGRVLDELVGNAAIGIALWTAALPARIAGVVMLHEFLERGYHAFSRMQGASRLLAAIEQRETIIMNKLFSAANEPFMWQRADFCAPAEICNEPR